jgi:hypothetical protein
VGNLICSRRGKTRVIHRGHLNNEATATRDVLQCSMSPLISFQLIKSTCRQQEWRQLILIHIAAASDPFSFQGKLFLEWSYHDTGSALTGSKLVRKKQNILCMLIHFLGESYCSIFCHKGLTSVSPPFSYSNVIYLPAALYDATLNLLPARLQDS